MKRIKLAAMVAAVGMCFSAHSFAADALDKAELKASKERIEADYKMAKDRCDAMSGNAKDVCQKEAKGNENIAKAELDARNKNTDKARREAAEAKIDAQYDVSKEKCDDLNGNTKDVCVKDAKAAKEKAVADLKTNFTGSAGGTSSIGDRMDARDDAKDAQYSAAKERCDAMSGDAKDRCVADVKTRFGK